ncbi:MAG: hypothetical protein JNK40_14370 [Chromatiales bacterium]|nr:hypothetical protein [Chromatiales bacterium]
MPGLEDSRQLVERLCARDDLATDDPYDIWKTRGGFVVKDLFNRRRRLGLLPAAALTLFDTVVNNRARWFYAKQEYPIVRAWAALALLNLHEREPAPRLLAAVRRHLDWLRQHASPGYSGPCWGIGFRQPISAGLIYAADLPLATMTPYPLEAFVRYHRLTGDDGVVPVIQGIHAFFDRDLQVMEETDDHLVMSYSALPDRRVVNVQSYVMFALGLLLPYLAPDRQDRARHRIGKLYRYLVRAQRPDGSWLYSPDGQSFVDCFHSCIVLKNLEKTRRDLDLPGAEAVIARGYAYLQENFRVAGTGLFKRFSVANKPSLVRYDLYDNAEMLNLAILRGDTALIASLAPAIGKQFVRGDAIYSQVDWLGIRRNRNHLRWAVMPWLYALSQLH